MNVISDDRKPDLNFYSIPEIYTFPKLRAVQQLHCNYPEIPSVKPYQPDASHLFEIG